MMKANTETHLIPRFLQSYHDMQLLTVHECISSIAHEVNQPLSATVNYINGCLHYLQDKEIPVEIMNALQEAASQAERAGNMAHQLKQFYNEAPLRHKMIDINNLVTNLVRNIEKELQEYKLTVQLKLTEAATTIPCYVSQLAQSLLCLILNAVEAMSATAEENRKLTIGTEIDAVKEKLIITISDTGEGIPMDIRDKIFKSFFTTKSGHAGVGLCIVQYIIEMHEGQILIDDKNNQTHLKLILPQQVSA